MSLSFSFGNISHLLTFILSEGCANGNCLRSHVNMTETSYALSMITKAGVPASKVVVGMAKYGRSFKMSDPSCHSPECTFTGPESGAIEGRCTKTAGYISNFEINEIVNGNGTKSYQKYHDEGDILVYDHDQWVSYLSAETYESRVNWVKDHNLGGISDWAIDLEKDLLEEFPEDGKDDDEDSEEICDVSLTFKSLEDLDAVAGKFSQYCVELYAAEALRFELETALDKYTEVNKGYDGLYKHYAHYVDGMIEPAIQKFMAGSGKKYFECKLFQAGVKNTTLGPCPPKDLSSQEYAVDWILKDSDGFYEELDKKYGVEKGWIKFDVFSTSPPCHNITGCTRGHFQYKDYPMKADNVTIPNPKDVIVKAPSRMTDLKALIDATYLDILLGEWDGSISDVVRTMGMPVALVEQAVDSMEQVKKMGEKIKKEEHKNLILAILSAVLFIIPFVGEFAAASAGLASMARIIALVGEAANAGLSIYEIVDDPKSAPMAVMGMLLGAAALPRVPASFSKMGNLMRAMKSEDVVNMGAIFSRKVGLVKRILRECT